MSYRMMLATFLVLVAIQVATTNSLAQTVVGKTLDASRTVKGTIGNRVLNTNSRIHRNEVLRSNRSGLGQFELSDGTLLAISPNARLKIDEAIYGNNSNSFSKLALVTTAGAIRVISGQSKSSAYEIKTPIATFGIRGTAFDYQYLNGRLYFMLLSGGAEICNNAGQCQKIERKCDCVVVGQNGKLSNVFQPRNGIFSRRDMERFFPFIADQSELVSQLQQRTELCKGGAGDHGGGIGDPGTGTSGTSPNY